MLEQTRVKPLKSANPLSARRLTRYYATALLIIAGLTVASHLLLTYVLQHNQGTAAIINVSGRQRMLSQRIASLAAEYQLGDMTARGAMITATDEFEATEARLSAESRLATSRDAETLQIQRIYVGTDKSLEAEANGFIADARLIASLSPADPAGAVARTRLFEAARVSLLGKLNTIVQIHQRETERVLAELRDLQLAIICVVLATLMIEALVIFRPMIERIVFYTGEITRLATIDPLTELLNRRGFLERCEVERVRAERHDRPLCLLMLDADNFKQINDTYGHEAGDEMLRGLSVFFREVLRSTDFAGRLGGEEFAILVPETDLPGAILLAERLRETVAIAKTRFRNHLINVTVSIGVTSVSTELGGIERALHESDLLMYQAKHAGRNRVVSSRAHSL